MTILYQLAKNILHDVDFLGAQKMYKTPCPYRTPPQMKLLISGKVRISSEMIFCAKLYFYVSSVNLR
jgi:hypothetical protein